MTMVATDVQTYLDRVAEIAPILREEDPKNEAARRLTDRAAEALREAGLYRLFVPAAYGGAEMHPTDACRVVAAVAEIDSAAGWNVSLATAATALGGMLDPSFADRVYADGPDAVVAVSVAAPASVVRDGDDFIATGELRFVSGADQATWIGGMAIELVDGMPVMDGEMPALYIVAVHRDQVEILDEWHTSAMRGTGSTNVKIDGVRLPAEQAKRIEALDTPSGRFDHVMFRAAPWIGVQTESAVSIGIARAAIRDLTELAVTKISASMEMNTIAHRDRTQFNLAKAKALVDGAEAYMASEMAKALDYLSTTDERLTDEHKAGLLLSIWTGADAPMRAVDLICEAAGTTSAMLSHRFERYERDVRFLAKHQAKSIERPTNVGRMMLGMPSGHPMLDL